MSILAAGPHDTRFRTLELLRRYGWNATGFQALERGFQHYFDGEDACVSYIDTGSAWVAAGAPIAPRARLAEVARSFVTAARRAGRRACFFAVEQRFVDETSLPSSLIGEQPTWDPRRWTDTMAERASLREQLRRARAKGVTIRAVRPAEIADANSTTRRAIEALVRRWLGTRSMPAMRFLVDVQLFDFADERRYFVAERDEAVIGLLAAVPIFARNGWLFEDLLRDPRAPNGTSELLVDEAMRAVAIDGARYVTLGLAPLAGHVPTWLGRIRRWTAALYDFDGVRAFKAKLSPQTWDPILLAHPHGTSPNLALYDALVAFAGGTFFGFGLRALLRGPAIVVRALSLLLVPWTLLLAFADASWFPSRAVHVAWVAFDVVLTIGLLALTRRWRPKLALVLASAITADALLTTAQAALYNVPRVESVTALVIVAVACAGPALGAVTLWGAIRRSRL